MYKLFLFTIILVGCGSGKGDSGADGADGAGGATGGSCNIGSDCSASEFCVYDYQNGNDPESGVCVALPGDCTGPTTCDECDLVTAYCPESMTTGCSDDMAGTSNPILSCS